MPVSVESLRALFESAMDQFLADDAETILANVHEQSSCAQLGMHMKALLPSFDLDAYNVDLEYDRNHGTIKTIINGKGTEIRVRCDLILHSRGRIPAEDNLIAVELKKFGRPGAEKRSDRERLQALTRRDLRRVYSGDGITNPRHVCGYKLGMFIQLDRKKRLCIVEYFQNGKRRDGRTRAI